MNDINLKFLSCFFDFANVSLVIFVYRSGSRVVSEVNIKVIDNIRKEFQLWSRVSIGTKGLRDRGLT